MKKLLGVILVLLFLLCNVTVLAEYNVSRFGTSPYSVSLFGSYGGGSLCASFGADQGTTGTNAFNHGEYSTRYDDNAFDDTWDEPYTTSYGSNGDDEGWIGYHFSPAKTIVKIAVEAAVTYQARTPTSMEFYAGSAEPTSLAEARAGTLLKTVILAAGGQAYPTKDSSTTSEWASSETKSWIFSNDTAYAYYWIVFWDKDENSFGNGSEYIMSEVGMYECAE